MEPGLRVQFWAIEPVERTALLLNRIPTCFSRSAPEAGEQASRSTFQFFTTADYDEIFDGPDLFNRAPIASSTADYCGFESSSQQ
jgi:hypothetical protein